MSSVSISFDVDGEITSCGLKKKEEQNWLKAIAQLHGKSKGHLHYIFTDDTSLRTMNNRYLQHDYETDIITFDLSDSASNALYGEMYISIDRVKENAEFEKVPYAEELRRVMAHGLLHLLGYNDHSEEEKAEMRKAEGISLAMWKTHCEFVSKSESKTQTK
jgi:probable rRNA maturation factor